MRRTSTHPYFYDSSDRSGGGHFEESHTHHSASDGHRVLQPGEIASFTSQPGIRCTSRAVGLRLDDTSRRYTWPTSRPTEGYHRDRKPS